MAVLGRRDRGRGRGADGKERGVTATARRGVGGGFLLAARIVMLIVSVIVAVIVAGILLKVLDANTGNSLVKGATDLARTLVGPFKDLFTIKDPKVSVAVNWGIAAAIYLIVGWIIAKILRGIGVKSHPDRTV